jgi:hypothetical protein
MNFFFHPMKTNLETPNENDFKNRMVGVFCAKHFRLNNQLKLPGNGMETQIGIFTLRNFKKSLKKHFLTRKKKLQLNYLETPTKLTLQKWNKKI